MKIFFLLIKNYLLAAKGWYSWHKIVHFVERKEDEFVFIFSSHNMKCNYYTLLYLEQFLNKEYSNSAVLITCDSLVLKAAKFFSKRIRHIIKVSPKTIEALLQYYTLCPFDSQMIVASLDQPEGRDGLCILGKHEITLEEMVVIGILGFPKFKKEKKLIYHGADEELKRFFGCIYEGGQT